MYRCTLTCQIVATSKANQIKSENEKFICYVTHSCNIVNETFGSCKPTNNCEQFRESVIQYSCHLSVQRYISK